MQITRIGPSDFTGYRRMMVFIDGENMTLRYKDMLSTGRQPKDTVKYLKDIYVWETQTTSIVGRHEIIRATYYTSAVGDDLKIDEVNKELKSFSFYKNHNSEMPDKLFPNVFKKDSKSRKVKVVDTQMSVDILQHSYNNNLDTVFLITGDGDFLPVIKEVIRAGKQIYLAAFSSGLNLELKKNVDLYKELDDIYFKSKT